VFKAAVRELSPAPLDLTEIPHGVTAVFSPRPDTSLLDSYAELLDSAGRQACITLAFGIASTFKEVLKDNTSASQLVFMLLEKRDRPSGNNPAESCESTPRTTSIKPGARSCVILCTNG